MTAHPMIGICGFNFMPPSSTIPTFFADRIHSLHCGLQMASALPTRSGTFSDSSLGQKCRAFFCSQNNRKRPYICSPPSIFEDVSSATVENGGIFVAHIAIFEDVSSATVENGGIFVAHIARCGNPIHKPNQAVE